jgi:putative endonuclease
LPAAALPSLKSSSPFAEADSTHERGRQAEADGRRWLAGKGYEILTANYRTPVGEIDVIAEEGGELCFIEIKARMSAVYGPATAAVTPRQQSRVARAASLYLQDTGYEGPCRFDVLGMNWDGRAWRFELIRDAFELA